MTRICLLRYVLVAGLVLSVGKATLADGVKHLPNDTEAVISINFKQIWGSKLAKENAALLKQLQNEIINTIDKDQGAADIRKSLGIDLFKDIDVVTMGMSDLTKQPKSVVIVLEGNFNPEKFKETADNLEKKNVLKAVTIGKKTVYEITGAPQGPSYIGLLNGKTLLVAMTKDGMTAAMSGEGGKLKKEIAEQVQNANWKHSMNFLMSSSAMADALKQSDNPEAKKLAPFVKDIKGMTLAVNMVSDVDVNLSYTVKDADTAKANADQLKAFVPFIKLMLGGAGQKEPKLAPWIDVLSNIKVSSQGTNVIATAVVPRKLMDEALKMVEGKLP